MSPLAFFFTCTRASAIYNALAWIRHTQVCHDSFPKAWGGIFWCWWHWGAWWYEDGRQWGYWWHGKLEDGTSHYWTSLVAAERNIALQVMKGGHINRQKRVDLKGLFHHYSLFPSRHLVSHRSATSPRPPTSLQSHVSPQPPLSPLSLGPPQPPPLPKQPPHPLQPLKTRTYTPESPRQLKAKFQGRDPGHHFLKGTYTPFLLQGDFVPNRGYWIGSMWLLKKLKSVWVSS